MNKLYLLFGVILLLSPVCFGEALFEREFGEMGHEAFLIEGAEKTGCKEVIFLFPEGIDITNTEVYPIASIGLEQGPVQEGKFDVNANLNDVNLAILNEKDFMCSEGTCWERIIIPKKMLLEEENRLEICLGTGNTITSLNLVSKSKIGLYKSEDFSGENAFRAIAEKNELVRGEKTRINMLLHNQGSAPSTVEIKFARPLAEDKNAFSVVEGKTYFTGVVKPGEIIEISYVVKPKISTYFALPPAIVYYKNVFGETESKFTNPVFLSVREPETKIEAFIVKDAEEAFVGENIGMKIAIKNVGNDPLYDLAVKIESEISPEGTRVIEAINPKETVYVEFNGNSFEAGKYSVGCIISYIDLNAEKNSCIESFVEFKERGIGPEVFAGLALVIVAVIIYVYITRF